MLEILAVSARCAFYMQTQPFPAKLLVLISIGRPFIEMIVTPV